MTNRMRYGKKFGGTSLLYTKGPGLGMHIRQPHFPGHPIHRKEQDIHQKISGAQNNSLAQRKRKGIKPAMPHFSFEPELPAKPVKSTLDYKYMANIAIPSARATEIIMEQGGHVLVSMIYAGKDFIACLNGKSGKLMWTEGEHAPRASRNGPSKRRDKS